MILMWKGDDEGKFGCMVLRRLRRKNEVEEIIAGRMAFHFYDGVGRPLLEASIAANSKREQDYRLPIEWKLPLAEYFFFT